MILVTGATGNAGGAVVRELVARGEPVGGLVRAGREASLPDGADVVVGDLNDVSTFRNRLDGVSGVFLMSGYAGMDETLAAMRGAGAGRVVLLSSSSVPGGDESNAVARYHLESEAAVKASGLEWTMLQPHSFMTNTLRWAPQLAEGDVVRLPFASVPISMVDPADIAAVAAESLLGDGHSGQTYRITGPEALVPADQVRIVGEAIGRSLEFVAMTDEEARADMEAGMPPAYVDAFMSFFADGKLDESPVLPTVREVTGREPRPLAEWARANAAEFPARQA